jgi:hypothetical protein
LRRVVDIPVSQEDIVSVLKNEVIKRDNLDGTSAELAIRKISRRCTKVNKIVEATQAAVAESSKIQVAVSPIEEFTPQSSGRPIDS